MRTLNLRPEMQNFPMANQVFNSLKFAGNPGKDGRAQPKIEEPDEENRGFEDIVSGEERTPESGGATERTNPQHPIHPETDSHGINRENQIPHPQKDENLGNDIPEEDMERLQEESETVENPKKEEFDIDDDGLEYEPQQPLKVDPDLDENEEEFDQVKEKPFVDLPDEEEAANDFPDEEEFYPKP